MATNQWLTVILNMKIPKNKKRSKFQPIHTSLRQTPDISIPYINPDSLRQTKLSSFYKPMRHRQKKKENKAWSLSNYNMSRWNRKGTNKTISLDDNKENEIGSSEDSCLDNNTSQHHETVLNKRAKDEDFSPCVLSPLFEHNKVNSQMSSEDGEASELSPCVVNNSGCFAKTSKNDSLVTDVRERTSNFSACEQLRKRNNATTSNDFVGFKPSSENNDADSYLSTSYRLVNAELEEENKIPMPAQSFPSNLLNSFRPPSPLVFTDYFSEFKEEDKIPEPMLSLHTNKDFKEDTRSNSKYQNVGENCSPYLLNNFRPPSPLVFTEYFSEFKEADKIPIPIMKVTRTQSPNSFLPPSPLVFTEYFSELEKEDKIEAQIDIQKSGCSKKRALLANISTKVGESYYEDSRYSLSQTATGKKSVLRNEVFVPDQKKSHALSDDFWDT